MAQIFSRSTNDAPRYTLIALVILVGAGTFAAYYWMSPEHTDVGYAPEQPVPYSHRLHVGELGLDCRYCHTFVERAPYAGVPATEICMNCHQQVKPDSPLLQPVRESWAEGKGGPPIFWTRVHKVPDFAYFDHSAHVGVGVGKYRAAIGCETCHGRIDTMEVVRQAKSLSMSWCLECHSDPAANIRPLEAMTAMGWTPSPAWRDEAARIAATLYPPGSLSRAQVVTPEGNVVTYATAGCSGCHR